MTLPETKTGLAFASDVVGVREGAVVREALLEDPLPRCAVANVPAHTIKNIMQMTNLRKRCAIAALPQAEDPRMKSQFDN
jgi:hypothetical protein